jgi:cholesterol oxidase
VLDGQVRFAALGGEVPADNGFAKLFAPTTDPNLKVMAYRVTFRHDGAMYCLDGVKHVRRRSVLHAWRDTTTLFCRLYDGTGTTGRILGAGTLHLTPLAFARQLGTFRTTHTRGIGRRVSTLARFLGFFTAQTIDTYFRRARVR